MGDYWFAAGLLLSIFGSLMLLAPVAALYGGQQPVFKKPLPQP